MKDILWLRDNIDRVDRQILELFLERMGYVGQVGEYKRQQGLPVYDAGREAQLLGDKVQSIEDERMRAHAAALFTELMDVSKDHQNEIIGKPRPTYRGKPARVSYCGAPGAYAQEAAVHYFGAQEMRAVGSFAQVVHSVLTGESGYGILPIENSNEGSVLEVYDLLGEHEVYIVGEHYLPVRHCLLGTGELEQVKTVASHPQALGQCSTFLADRGFAALEHANTALAAKMVGEANDPSLAAIASAHVAKIYGLNILCEDIANSHRNFTRFVVIGRSQEHQGDYEKVSLTFALPHKQGALLEVLKRFEKLNLTKIESRPKGKWEYLFYLDFEGGKIDGMIEEIKNMQILGTYLKGEKKR